MELKVYGLCRLTRDAEIRYSQGANPQAFATFGIACGRSYRREGEPEADFYDCVAFGGKAEFIGKYLGKGSQVFLEGELRNDNYTNRDGQKVYRNRIFVTNIEFADSKRNDNDGAAAPQAPTAAPAPAPTQKAAGTRQSASKGGRSSRPAAPAPQQSDGFMNIPDGIGDELDFLN